jgi:hypothetical protein
LTSTPSDTAFTNVYLRIAEIVNLVSHQLNYRAGATSRLYCDLNAIVFAKPLLNAEEK